MTMLYALLPEFLVIAALLLIERRRDAPRTDWRMNVQVWLLQLAVGVALLPLVQGWTGPALIDGRQWPFWIGLLLFVLLKDAAEFAYHYAQHRIPALWAMHSLHHSDPAMAVLTTQRHFWGDQIVKQVTVWSVVLMIMKPTPAIAFGYGIIALWNLFAHLDAPINFGRWSWLLNSPAYHRRHHSILPEHYDTNFAGLFPIFDVLCGTYRRPDSFPPTGLASRPRNLWEAAIWPLIWNRAARAQPCDPLA
jgi:sterol desaturase/sphingolipid hydroxylase (fatty acid hydroxylase superfamily)